MLNRRAFIRDLSAFGALAWASDGRSAPLTPSGIPAYSEAMADDFVRRVAVKARTAADGFYFITDLHILSNARRSGQIIAALSGRAPVSRILCGGDLPVAFTQQGKTDRECLTETTDTYCELWAKPFRAAGMALYTAKGNHDFTIRRGPEIKEGLTLSAEEARRIIIDRGTERGVVLNAADPTGCYYYFDNVAAKVRTVVADTTDAIEPNRTFWAVLYGMHATQLQWLAEQAFGTVPVGWSIVVMHHIPVAPVVGCDGDVQTFREMRELMEAYQNRTAVELCGRSFDFSGAKGRILLDLTGHHHTERATYRRGILHVTNPCDAAYQDYRYANLACGELPVKRASGPYEQTFDAVQLDPANDQVRFTRFGGGTDRTYHLKPVFADKGGSVRLEARLPGAVVGCGMIDADFAFVRKDPKRKYGSIYEFRSTYATIDEKGVVSSHKPGESIAWLVHADGEREFFNVKSGA